MLLVHPRLQRGVAGMPAGGRRAVYALAALVSAALLAVAGVGLLQWWLFPPAVPVIPLLITGGVALATYTAVLHTGLPTRADGSSARAPWAALLVLLAGGIFWTWGSYAGQVGTSSARETAASLACHADVSVFSARKPGLSGHGIHVDAIGDAQSVYHVRYTGLRLLLRSGNRYFLLPDDWHRGEEPVIILSESAEVRLQFVAPPYP